MHYHVNTKSLTVSEYMEYKHRRVEKYTGTRGLFKNDIKTWVKGEYLKNGNFPKMQKLVPYRISDNQSQDHVFINQSSHL